jgi:hypothetical protein
LRRILDDGRFRGADLQKGNNPLTRRLVRFAMALSLPCGDFTARETGMHSCIPTSHASPEAQAIGGG